MCCLKLRHLMHQRNVLGYPHKIIKRYKKVWDLDPVFLSQAKALPQNQWELTAQLLTFHLIRHKAQGKFHFAPIGEKETVSPQYPQTWSEPCA